jgi:hypothetical protein
MAHDHTCPDCGRLTGSDPERIYRAGRGGEWARFKDGSRRRRTPRHLCQRAAGAKNQAKPVH